MNAQLRRQFIFQGGGREEGIPWIWVTGGALVTILLLIVSLLGYIFSMGAVALWPRDIVQISKTDAELGSNSADAHAAPGAQNVMIGSFHRRVSLTKERDVTPGSQADGIKTEPSAAVEKQEPLDHMIYQANQDFGGKEFVYVSEKDFAGAVRPSLIWRLDRREWGPFVGFLKALSTGAQVGASRYSAEELNKNPALFQHEIVQANKRRKVIEEFKKNNIAPLNLELERIRLALKRNERLAEKAQDVSMNGTQKAHQTQQTQQSEATVTANWMKLRAESDALSKAYEESSAELRRMQDEDRSQTVTLVDSFGVEKTIPLSNVIRAFQPNALSFREKFDIYTDRVLEFIFDEPREANTQGGIFPAIFGTVVMTLLMTLAVLPAGVMAAIYIREIAKQGVLVSIVRIAVGNLAGVPSIVFGIFGLGFFCYTLGGSIDEVFFSDKLPAPTFGTGGVLWASLTLALLTLPVVVVSTEEALQAVPRSIREASYGCGATRLQTIVRVVIPRAMPGIMTGLILAMARGMGEVAPLLVTGVVKLAPQLPIDGQFPFFHFERSFMHLGFHIYDVGFQSRSAEVSRPMVFASTALLVGLVFVLNLVAIRVRSQLRKRFEGRGAF